MAQIGRAAIVALAALLVVDVALVALALRHVQASDFGETVAAPSANGGDKQGNGDNQGSGGGNQGNGDNQGNGGQQTAKAPETMINVGGDGAVGRAVVGSCTDGGAKVELSSDGGSTWTEVTPELEVVVRVSVTSADEATVVGASADCEEVTTYSTSNGGGAWEEQEDSATWHSALDGGAGIYSPYGGTADVPCADGEGVAAVSMLSNDQVIALCDDGVVQVSTDAGSNWEHVGDLQGATAVDFLSETSGLGVVPNGEGCKGVAVMRTEDGGASWESSGCLKTNETGAAHISASGDSAYVALGNSTWASEDAGESWSPVGE